MRDNSGPNLLGENDIQQIIRPRMVPFFNNTGATILAGNCVVIDQTAVPATRLGVPVGACIIVAPATAVAARKIRGAAFADIPDQTFGLVQVAGFQTNVSVLTGIAADSPLIGSVATAGRLIAATFAAGEYPVALSMTLAAANLASVLWTVAGV